MLKSGTLPGRALAIMLLGAAAFGGYQLLIVPLVGILATTAQRVEQASILLRRYRWLAAQHPVLAKQLAELQEQMAAFDRAYLRGSDDALATAELLDLARSVIEKTGGEVNSAEISSAEAVAGTPSIHRVAVSVQTDLPIDGLAKVIYTLETGQPYVFINGLVIGGEQHGRINDLDGEVVLKIVLEIVSYWRDR